MKHKMYKGKTIDGKRVKGWLAINCHKKYYILEPLPDRGDPDYGGIMQYFNEYEVIPKTVRRCIF